MPTWLPSILARAMSTSLLEPPRPRLALLPSSPDSSTLYGRKPLRLTIAGPPPSPPSPPSLQRLCRRPRLVLPRLRSPPCTLLPLRRLLLPRGRRAAPLGPLPGIPLLVTLSPRSLTC